MNNYIQEQFLPYEESLELKNIGFDEECLGFYYGKGKFSFFTFIETTQEGKKQSQTNESFVTAPLYQQVFDWFLEKHKVINYPEFDFDEQKWFCNSDYNRIILFNTKKEAELACIRGLIKIVKEKQ